MNVSCSWYFYKELGAHRTKTGSFKFAINKDCPEDLWNPGNWDPKIQEKHYSTKLPMKQIHRKVGLMNGNHMNFNPHVTFPVPEELLEQVFPWLA